MKVKNLKITSAFMALVVAGGIAVGSISNAYADTKYKEGTFINETVEYNETNYNQYVVKKGDTLSNISIKICRYFNEEKTTKYWPAIAFLNDYPRVSKPGDIIVFPETFEQLDTLNSDLRSIGWTARYIQNNKIYGNNKQDRKTEYNIRSLLTEIYGDRLVVTDAFIDNYLLTIGVQDKYTKDDLQSIDYDTLFVLTEWIPTIEELGRIPKIVR